MKYKITLNEKTYEVEVVEDKAILLDEYEAVAPKATPVVATPVVETPVSAVATQPVGAANENAVKAPIGGLVLSTISVGSTVKSGDVVVVIEAMKMENEIVAPKAGKVSQIYVSKGATVKTGAPLFEIA